MTSHANGTRKSRFNYVAHCDMSITIVNESLAMSDELPCAKAPHGRFTGYLRPGDWVSHLDQPGWGAGQVQSVIGPRATVNFEHAGKVLVNVAQVTLELIAR